MSLIEKHRLSQNEMFHDIFSWQGGGGGGSDEVWDRETMFSQLAKRSIRGLVSDLPRRRCVFS